MPSFDVVTVTSVRHHQGTLLEIVLSDGKRGTLDLAKEGALRHLDPSQARIDQGVLRWPDGTDVNPDWLHERLAAQSNDDAWRDLHQQVATMPEISRFFGIVIRMYYADHVRPHFHAVHGDQTLSVEIDGDGVHGSFPPSRLPLLFEWRDRHRDALRINWDRLRHGMAPLPIAPLD
jgi:hypothetical protein